MSHVGMNKQSFDECNQELLVSWLAVIESITMFWSPVERQIDQCVHLLYERLAAKKAIKKPFRLSDKLKFIKSNIPPTIINSDSLKDLAALTIRTVQIRDVCVHGVMTSYNEHEIKIGKVDGKKSEHVIEVFTIDRARLNRSALALSTLQERWALIASALLEASPYAQTSQSRDSCKQHL